MKLKKIISVFAALAIVVSSFVGLATVSYAAPAANSNPALNISFSNQNSSGVCFFPVTLTGGDTLNFASSTVYDEEEDDYITTYSGTSISALQIQVTLDPTVFDVSTSQISNLPSGATPSGDGTATLTVAFGPTSIDGVLGTYSNYLFRIKSKLNAGYTKDTIPNNAMTITKAIIEYSAYTSATNMAQKDTFTIYAYNAPSYDYPLAVSFTGTLSDAGFEVAKDANGIVSFDNYSDIDTTNPRYSESDKTPSAILTDNQVKLFTQKFTGVTVNTRFEIGHNGETKTFGWTIGDYFDITGSGALSGSLGVAVIFPKDDPSTDFTITPVNASTLD